MKDPSIRSIERQIDQIKLLNQLGKVPHGKARLQIKALELELKIAINELPPYERSLYRIKKEYGKEF